MQNYSSGNKVATPSSPTRWRPHLFKRPALTRRDILDRRSVAHLSDADRAYLEAYDVLSAFPGCLEAIYAGLADAAIEAQGGQAA